MDKYLISIVGPTGIGKTNLSLKLASNYNSEIISSDSRQFYKEIPIGTAAPTIITTGFEEWDFSIWILASLWNDPTL